MNRTLLQMIRCTLEGGQHNWDDRLQLLMAAIRSTPNRSTGFTPNKLMLGREVRLPLQLVSGMPAPTDTAPEYVRNLEKELAAAHQLAREHLEEQQIRQKRDYDVHPVQAKYQVGDVIMLYDFSSKMGQAKKLKPMWLGPFVVSAVVTPTLIKISSLKRDWLVHHDRLKPCHTVDLPLWVQRRRHALLDIKTEGQSPTLSKSGCSKGHLQEEPVFCICRKPDNGRPMVCCDVCDEWFHCDCVKISDKIAMRLDRFVCPMCKSV
jgi:hypothetical protein